MSSLPTLIAVLVALNAVAYPCSVIQTSRSRIIDVAPDIVKRADVIVRATAVGYAIPAEDKAGSVRFGSIRFDVVEVLKGKPGPQLILEGELVARDDFNSHSSPYNGVRPNGLSGSCFAWQYRTGGQYLLILKRTNAAQLTANWYPLGPSNEQLHSPEDPWLVWVRDRARSHKR